MNSVDRMAGPAREERRFALRRATDAAHRRVEGILQAAGMFRSREAYVRYLKATYEMRTRFERLLDLAEAERLWPDWPARRIAALVAEDLADLDAAPDPRPAPPKSSLSKKARPDLTQGELLGILYVLEGSSLGARVLVNVSAEIGLSAAWGARHLHRQAHGSNSCGSNSWRSFLALLSASPEPPCHQSAIETFEAFARAYERAAI